MVFRLAANVFAHRLDMHRADVELAVTGLPREIGIPRVLLLDPTRRRFNLLDNLRGRVVLGLREQDVNVVAHGIDFESWFLRMPVM